MAANWKIADVGRFLKDSGWAILKGEFLLRINMNKYFIHAIWTFFLFFMAIWISFLVEKTLTKVEQNAKTLNDLEIYHAQKTVELVSLGRMTTIEQMLKEQGSKLGMPTVPPKTIGE